MTEVQAALGIPQLARLAERNHRRCASAAGLSEGLAGIKGLVTPRAPAGREHVFHQYTVRVTGDARLTRDELARRLVARGIETAVYYPRAVYDYDCYREHPLVDAATMPRAEAAATEVLSLPVHPFLTEADLETIVGSVRELLGA
jgi:dTDP-4-amino-4,6-dideoxygalactose transaminase